MARIRTVKPEMAQDEDLATVSIEAQLLAVRLLNQSDDEGYFNANPLLIKASCFPLIDSVNVPVVLRELSEIGYFKTFDGKDGKKYGFLPTFTKHQVINKPRPSKIKDLVALPEDYGSDTVDLPSGKEGKGKERKGETPLSTPAALTGDQQEEDSKPKPPPCPHREIIALYHDTLPELPRIVEATWPDSEAAKHLRTRWLTHPDHQDLTWWRNFFLSVRGNPHWMGANGWKANLRWLVNKTNFTKVVEQWANAA